MVKSHVEVDEILICSKCEEEIYGCDKCDEIFYDDYGDIYCRDGYHYCKKCGGRKKKLVGKL